MYSAGAATPGLAIAKAVGNGAGAAAVFAGGAGAHAVHNEAAATTRCRRFQKNENMGPSPKSGSKDPHEY
jgi:hypothetical protein